MFASWLSHQPSFKQNIWGACHCQWFYGPFFSFYFAQHSPKFCWFSILLCSLLVYESSFSLRRYLIGFSICLRLISARVNGGRARLMIQQSCINLALNLKYSKYFRRFNGNYTFSYLTTAGLKPSFSLSLYIYILCKDN